MAGTAVDPLPEANWLIPPTEEGDVQANDVLRSTYIERISVVGVDVAANHDWFPQFKQGDVEGTKRPRADNAAGLPVPPSWPRPSSCRGVGEGSGRDGRCPVRTDRSRPGVRCSAPRKRPNGCG
jgi:hypothetical protein